MLLSYTLLVSIQMPNLEPKHGQDFSIEASTLTNGVGGSKSWDICTFSMTYQSRGVYNVHAKNMLLTRVPILAGVRLEPHSLKIRTLKATRVIQEVACCKGSRAWFLII